MDNGGDPSKGACGMQVFRSGGSASRIASASALIVVLVATAVGVTIWRYEHALAQSDRALEARSEEVHGEEAATAFWKEREAMNEYLVTPADELASEVAAAQARFNELTNRLVPDSVLEAHVIKLARLSNNAWVSYFDQNRAAAEKGHAASLIDVLNRGEPAVARPLEQLQRINKSEVQAHER
jgi:hypothetical protein